MTPCTMVDRRDRCILNYRKAMVNPPVVYAGDETEQASS
jgi:hypothetical protein